MTRLTPGASGPSAYPPTGERNYMRRMNEEPTPDPAPDPEPEPEGGEGNGGEGEGAPA